MFYYKVEKEELQKLIDEIGAFNQSLVAQHEELEKTEGTVKEETEEVS
jgi:hypothetical protein